MEIKNATILRLDLPPNAELAECLQRGAWHEMPSTQVEAHSFVPSPWLGSLVNPLGDQGLNFTYSIDR